MRDLVLIGVGTGNPDHLTLQGAKAINSADLILLPRKGADKADLADLRRQILAAVLTNPATQVVEFDLPRRDAANPDYHAGVDAWHDAIALAWTDAIAGTPRVQRVALLVWGDPSLYDSTLRIAARLHPQPNVTVIPGITALQALCAAHAITVNDIGAPFAVTTGRRLRETGFPAGVDTCIIMLDGETSFQSLDPTGIDIWWGAYLGMDAEITECGPLRQAGPRIVAARAAARERHGWIMDIYLLRRRES